MLLGCSSLYAQVPKKVIVEHFTNTKCSVCASRNPGFYSNLANHPNILHLAIHPTSPYAACLLAQQNNPDNDARTNYYGLYGSTPRFVINGTSIATNADYSNSVLFSPFSNQTSPISIHIKQHKFGTDSITSTIIIKTEANHSYGTLKLFGVLAEDSLFYTSPNGESLHHDVYRKSLFGAEGMTITIPANIGDSLVYNVTSLSNNIWNFDRIYTLALLQIDDTKEVIQAEAIPASQQDSNQPTALTNNPALNVLIYPNPTSSNLSVQLEKEMYSTLQLISTDGKPVYNTNLTQFANLDVSTLPKGLYILVITNPKGRIIRKITVE